jgi:uncharacterized membrane protein
MTSYSVLFIGLFAVLFLSKEITLINCVGILLVSAGSVLAVWH